MTGFYILLTLVFLFISLYEDHRLNSYYKQRFKGINTFETGYLPLYPLFHPEEMFEKRYLKKGFVTCLISRVAAIIAVYFLLKGGGFI